MVYAEAFKGAQGTNAFSKGVLPASAEEGKAARDAILVSWIVLLWLLPVAFDWSVASFFRKA